MFVQMERLTDEDLKGDALAAQMINNARLALSAQEKINDGLIKTAPAMLGIKNLEDV